MIAEVTEVGYTALWVAFWGMFLPMLYFYYLYSAEQPGRRFFHAITTIICGMASLSYLYMATGHGYVLVDDRAFYFMRYIDWILTTPLLLMDLCGLAVFSAEKTTMLVLLDVLMVIAGILGGVVPDSDKYYFWAMGTLFYIAIVYSLFSGMSSSSEPLMSSGREDASSIYKLLAYMTVILWTGYPIVWIFAEGEGAISPDLEAILYAILDLSAKSVFGFILLHSRSALSQASKAMGEAQPLLGKE
uniref:Rhodopsin n=1 Tax=Pinguiococcus pyrenoidosus TaxID=172671 RepID=A0A7R9U5N0_9STRA|mmetsp:Transcript_1500/g.6559  ORF Transcript_1500/g.6559 Transcript_1500/m.6559 type:complete len:245 (+) Transcript_1500:120-854(+)|eukprot:scaffold8168_cov239-Pinguiococcus_pyrenoidosus.AAC.2